MALGHANINRNTDLGGKFVRAAQMIYEGRAQLRQAVESATQYKLADGDGNGSQVVGAGCQAALGAASVQDAADAIAEMESLDFKLNTNGQQTDVANAISNALARIF
jgi:hypothetical protein